MRPKRILIFASYFAPNSFSEALTNNKFALALKKNGYDLTIITTSSYIGAKYEDNWSTLWEPLKQHTHNISSSNPSSKNKIQNKIKVILSLKHPINGMSWAYKAFELAIKLHNESPFDFVISRSISDFGHLPALKFKKTTNIKWAANWNDPPFFIFPPPYQEKTNFIDKFFYIRYIKSVAKFADFNTFPSRRLNDYMQKNLGVFKESKTQILPHLNTDLGLNTNVPKGNGFRICHAGNLSKERSPESFMMALKKLNKKYDGLIECYIVGLENVGLNEKVKELGLEGVIKYTGSMSYDKTLEFLRTCTVGLLIESKCEEGIFLPSKVSDYVQANLPILAVSPKVGTIRDLFNDFGGGLVCDNTDETDIFISLERLYLDWTNNKLNDYSSEKLKNYLSEDYMLNKYRQFLSN